MEPLILFGLFILGACTGVLAGMMGIGGGMIMVPFLVIGLADQGLPADQIIKIAIATSLTTILFTSVSSVISHQRRGAVRWPIVATLTPGIVIGTVVAAQLVGLAPGRLVSLFFASFLLWSSYHMMKQKVAATDAEPGKLPGRATIAGIGGLIGLLSALVGAGGGFMTVPFLARAGIALPQAVGTSAACGFPIALAGAIGYAIAGRQYQLPESMLGFIHLPALLAISAGSVLTAPLGARLAHSLPTHILKRLLASGLFLVGLYMGYRAMI